MKRNNTTKNLENDMNDLKTTLITCKRIIIKLAGVIAHHRFPQSCSQALLDTQRVCTAILDTNILQKKTSVHIGLHG